MKDLDFKTVSEVNRKRCGRWHPGFPHDEWTGADWSNFMCGEAGEAANIVKKLRRLEVGIQQGFQSSYDEAHHEMLLDKLATEIGDTFIYLDLLAQYYGLNTDRCVVDTFNRVSEREGFPERL